MPLGNRFRVAIGVMDRDDWSGCTDNIVVVDVRARTLWWVPRDIWSGVVGDRINEAFRLGGHDGFEAALAGLGLPVASSLVLMRAAVERALRDLRITVPVGRTMRYWYPVAPRLRLEDGAKLIQFDPPEVALSGEQLHQWIGARRSADPQPPALPDLDRIGRQQVLVRRLLEEHAGFQIALEDPALVSMSDSAGLGLLSRVGADWRLRTLDWVTPVVVDGKHVLRVRNRLAYWLVGLRRLLRTGSAA